MEVIWCISGAFLAESSRHYTEKKPPDCIALPEKKTDC